MQEEQIKIKIEGMGCTGCADRIQKALNQNESILSASVDHEKGSAFVTVESGSVTAADLKQIIEKTGYLFKGIG